MLLRNSRKRARVNLLVTSLVFLFLVGIFSSIFMPSRGLATIIWQDGLESGNTNAWDYVAGTVDVGTGYVFTGIYSANLTSTLAVQNHYLLHNLPTPYPTLQFFCCQYYVDALSLPTESYPDVARIDVMELGTDGPKGLKVSIQKTPFSGTGYAWHIEYIDAGSYTWDDDEPGYSAALEPAAGHWYGIEMSWNHTSGNTGTAVWIEGTNIWNDISSDVYSTEVQYGMVGAYGYDGSLSYTFKASIDDCSFGDAYMGCPAVTGAGGDTTLPEFLDGNPYLETNTLSWNTSLAGELCTISVNATDNVGLSGYFLSYTTDINGTVWHNNTWASTSGKNTKISDNFTVPIPTVEGWLIYAVFYANDTSDNWGVSLGLWPATNLAIGPAMNGTQINTLIPAGYGSGNKAGSRRVFHSTNYWVAFYECDQRIYSASSPDGNTWTEQGEVNSGVLDDMLADNDTTAWAPFVWGTNLYCMYATGFYDVGSNQTTAFIRAGTIDAVGTISWTGGLNLTTEFRTLIAAAFPGPGETNIIFGYWSFSWTISLDRTCLWFGFRVTGSFSGEYSRIFIGRIPAVGGTLAKLSMGTDSGTYYDMEQFSIVTDPSHNTGFLLVYRSHDTGYVYYVRYTGSSWEQVKYPEISAYYCALGSTTDWSTVYVPSLARTYWSGKNVGTYYFYDDPDRTGRFIEGGPTITDYDQINIGHTDQDVYIVCTDETWIYVYSKHGPTIGMVEGASWSSATVKAKALNQFTGLSCTEDGGLSQKVGLLWGNISEYWSSYDVLFSEWGSARFQMSLNVDFEGCGNWVFVNERYYNFNLTVIMETSNVSLIDAVMLKFTSLTRNGYVANTFQYQDGNWTVSFSPTNTTMIPTRIQDGEETLAGWSTAYFNFRIYFASDSVDIWKDDCVDVESFVNDTEGYSTGWQLIAPNLFRVYAQGGFILNNTVTGDAGILDTGTPFSFYAENDSYVYRDLIYRDLVHIKMLPQISGIIGRQTFYVQFGVDYCLKDYDWVEGWKVILGANSITTGSIIYFNWTVSFWNRGSWITTEYLSTFVHTNVPRGYYMTDREYGFTTSLWIDFWFDRTNASSVGGVRVNSYEYPMRDGVEAWLALLTSNWGPIENCTKELQQMVPLLDGDDVTVIPASQIKLMKVWSSLEVPAYTTNQTILMSDYPVWDLTFSQPFPPLTGIQTPIFDATTYPNMPGGGIMGALFSSLSALFSWMGENILYGGLRIWPALVGFLDTIAAWMGFPGGFSAIMAWLQGGWSQLVLSWSYIAALLLQFFIFLGSIMGYLVSLLTMAITQFVNIITMTAGFFQGGYGTGVDIWNAYGLTTWLTLACICYPIYLVILWDEEGFDALINHLMFVFNVLSLLAHFFISVIQMIFNGIHTLIEAIPVVE